MSLAIRTVLPRVAALAAAAALFAGCAAETADQAPDEAVAMSTEALGSSPDQHCTPLTFNGSHYFYCTDLRSFSDARSKCQAVGMDLVVIESAAEDAFLTPNIPLVHSWIGASDSGASNQWKWLPYNELFWSGSSTGSAVNGAFTNWELLRPTNDSQDCAVKDPKIGKGDWETRLCSLLYTYICEESDQCPTDPNKTAPGKCGCGVPETNRDGDSAPDCVDACPDDATKTFPSPCPCGVPTTDSDGDKIPDCIDDCDHDSGNAVSGMCGCKGEANQAPAGTACRDGLCPGHNTCNANAQCGSLSCAPAANCKAVRSSDPTACAIYWVCPTATSWTAADTQCRNAGGRWLADMGSAAENRVVRDLLTSAGVTAPAWVGGNDRGLNNAWRWPQWNSNNGQQFWSGSTSGTRFGNEYANWASGMPASGDCVAMRADGTWQSSACNESHPFVCRAYDHLCVDQPVNVPPVPTQPPINDPEPPNCVDSANAGLGQSFDLTTVNTSDVCGPAVNVPDSSCDPCADPVACDQHKMDIGALESQLKTDAETNGTSGPGWSTNCPPLAATEQVPGVEYSEVGDLSKCGLQDEITISGQHYTFGYHDDPIGAPCSSSNNCNYLAGQQPYATIISQAGFQPLFICVPVSGNDCSQGKNACRTVATTDPQGNTGFLPEKRCHIAAFEFTEAHSLTQSDGQVVTTPAHYHTSCLPDPVSAPGAGPEKCYYADLCNPPGAKGNSKPDETLLQPLSPTDPPGLPAAGIQPNPSTTYAEETCPGNPGANDANACYCKLEVKDIGPLADGDNQVGDTGGGPWNLTFDPTVNYALDVTPKPLGESKFDISAQGELKVAAKLFGAAFTVLDAKAQLALHRCSFKWDRTMNVLAPPLGTLGIGDYFLDNIIDLPPSFDSGDPTGTGAAVAASKACTNALTAYETASNKVKKAFRDAELIVNEYRNTIKAAKKFDKKTFCSQMAHYSQTAGFDFPSMVCTAVDDPMTVVDERDVNAVPEEVINHFIEQYNNKVALLKTQALDQVRTATQALSSVTDAASGLGFAGQFPATRREYGDNFGGNILTFPFAIGPVPMVFSLDVFANYGLSQPVFTYKLDPTAVTYSLACPFLAAFGGCNNTQSPIASVGIEFGPNASAGASLFLGAGFSIDGFSITLGVNGDLTLIRVGAPVSGAAVLNTGIAADTRAIPQAVALTSTRPDKPLSTADAAVPPIRASFALGWKLGGKIVLSDILKGTVSARLRLKLSLFFFTLRFEYKQRLFQFAGFGPKTYPLFDVSSKTGANTGNLGSAYAGDPVPATDTEDLGVIENKVPFIEIKTLPIPSPTTAIKDLLPAGIKVTDLPSGFTGNELYQSLVIQPSDPTKFPGLIWENQCVPPPDPGGPG